MKNKNLSLSLEVYVYKPLLLLIFFYFLVSNISFTIGYLYPIIEYSDYSSVLDRLHKFYENKISFLDYIFTKHVDHNHAFVYFLSYVDFEFFGGNLYLHKFITLICSILSALLLCYIIMRTNLKVSYKLLFYLVIIVSVFSLSSFEVLLSPFQVVLVSFKFLLLGSIFLFVFGVKKNSSYLLINSYITSFFASVSHGSGILIVPLLLIFSVIFKSKKAIVIGFLLGIFVILFENVYKTTSPLQLQNIVNSILNLTDLIYYTLAVLGNYLLYDHYFSVPLAFISVVYFLLILVNFLFINRKALDSGKNFFVIYGVFSLLSTFLSVILNMSYVELRGYEEITEFYEPYFFAFRYSTTVHGFWLSLFVLGIMYTLEIRDIFYKKLLQKFIIFLSVIFILFNVLTGFDYLANLEQDSKKNIEHQKLIINEKNLMSPEERYVYKIQHLYKKGVFSENHYLKYNLYQSIDEFRINSNIKYIDQNISIIARNILELKDELILQIKSIFYEKPAFMTFVNFSDIFWKNGINKGNNKCFLINKNLINFLKTGEELKFKSGNRLIQSAKGNEICVDKDLDLEIDSFPNKFAITNKIFSIINIERINDQNWTNGISNYNKNTLCSSTKLQLEIGDKLEFSSGIRTIIHIERTNQFQNITVDGNELDPYKDGKVEIIKLLKEKNRENNYNN